MRAMQATRLKISLMCESVQNYEEESLRRPIQVGAILRRLAVRGNRILRFTLHKFA
jgi:hypothetical protein